MRNTNQHGCRLRQAQWDHEGDGSLLQRDAVGSQLDGTYAPHKQRGGGEQADFGQNGYVNRMNMT